jgi:hypothetical protein
MRELYAVLPNGIADLYMRTCVRWVRLVPRTGRPDARSRRATSPARSGEARDLPRISLVDAAELVVLAAEQHGPSFDRWAGRC